MPIESSTPGGICPGSHFFDEIQELPNWEKFVRRVSDSISSHIFLTGSNSRFLSKEIATSLRGRGISFEILPLSFKEYLTFCDLPAELPASSKEKALVTNAFEDYCIWGGFPELVHMDDRFKAKVLQEYFNVMFYRDLVEHYRLSDPAVARFLIKRLMSSFTKEFSVNKLYNDLKSREFFPWKRLSLPDGGRNFRYLHDGPGRALRSGRGPPRDE
jgi:predicted AAA+ superfamily ATPase